MVRRRKGHPRERMDTRRGLEKIMTRNLASALAFAATVAAAIVAAVLVSGTALAYDTQTASNADNPTAIAGYNAMRLDQVPADELKQGYLMCERAIAQTLPDVATFAACSSVYEELRGRVFGGDTDALISWLRQAWPAGAESR
jgi:hypothetical protein